MLSPENELNLEQQKLWENKIFKVKGLIKLMVWRYGSSEKGGEDNSYSSKRAVNDIMQATSNNIEKVLSV